MRTFGRNLVLALFATIALSASAYCQDTFKISAQFANLSFADLYSLKDNQGLTIEGEARIAKWQAGDSTAIRIGGVGQWHRANLSSPIKLDKYSMGVRLNADLANGLISPYVHELVGFGTTYNRDRFFANTFGGGVDINLKHVFVRLVNVDVVSSGPFGTFVGFSAGVGFKF